MDAHHSMFLKNKGLSIYLSRRGKSQLTLNVDEMISAKKKSLLDQIPHNQRMSKRHLFNTQKIKGLTQT